MISKKNKALGAARVQIDKIDSQMLKLLAKRKKIVEKVALIKLKSDIPVKDPSREKKMISKRLAKAKLLHLDMKMTEAIFTLILSNSRICQAEIKKRHKGFDKKHKK